MMSTMNSMSTGTAMIIIHSSGVRPITVMVLILVLLLIMMMLIAAVLIVGPYRRLYLPRVSRNLGRFLNRLRKL